MQHDGLAVVLVDHALSLGVLRVERMLLRGGKLHRCRHLLLILMLGVVQFLPFVPLAEYLGLIRLIHCLLFIIFAFFVLVGFLSDLLPLHIVWLWSFECLVILVT